MACRIPRIALLIETHAGYSRGVLRGIARYALARGPWLVDLPAEKFPLSELVLPAARQWDGDGIIGRILTERVARQVLSARVPVIGMDLSEEQLAPGHLLSGISELRPDSHAAGRLAAEHFLECGFRHFAFCGYAGRIWSRRRKEGFCSRLAEAGFSCSVYEPLGHPSEPVWERERPQVIQWLRSLSYPLGLMACNDHRGRQVLEACLVAGLDVPHDIAVVGVDDDRLLCDLSNPPLSSIGFNAEKGGFQAAELLAGLMAGRVRGPQQILVAPIGVTIRFSTDVIAVEDRHVARALRFIRENSRRPIRVGDVVPPSGIGRRALEIRFQRALNRSIHDQIQQTHLEWVSRLLAETDLPLEKVVEHSGFNSLSHLSNVFRRKTGMTLAQYRRHTRPV